MAAPRMVWEFIQARDHQVMRKVHRWRTPLAALLDDRFHQAGRWVGLVHRWDRRAPVRRRHAFCGFCRRLRRRSCNCLDIPFDKESQQKKAPVPARIALLVKNSSTRPVFLPFGPRDERVCHRHSPLHLLPAVAGGSACAVGEHCHLACRPGNALRERRRGGIFNGSWIGIRSIPTYPLVSPLEKPIESGIGGFHFSISTR